MKATLASILARYPPSARPLGEPVPLGNAGGLSGARLWRFDSARGPLVLRLWPENGPGLEAIARIHRWLARADSLGFVPIPLPATDGQTIFREGDRFGELAPWKPGASAPIPYSDRHASSAFGALARFHRAVGEETPNATSPGLASRADEIQTLLSGNLDRWRSIVGSSPRGEVREMALQWIQGASRNAPRLLPEILRASRVRVPVRPVLRDARPEHFLFDGDRVGGLVDFGAMGIDTASADLARLIEGSLGGSERKMAAALVAYDSFRMLTEPERQLIGAFLRSAALLAGARWVRWHFEEGRRFDNANAVSDGLRRGVERLERLGTG